MNGVIDFHSHILPAVDDGSASVEESIEMLQMEKAHGVTHIVATPHFYADCDVPEAFLDRRDRAEEKLRRAMEGFPDLPEIIVGAEVHYFRGINDSDVLHRLAIRGTSAIMIEMPGFPWPDSAWTELGSIYERHGILPIVAHLDRYVAPLRTYGIPEKLAELPVLVQANADFFLRRSTVSLALRLLRQDKIHLLGSDCHGPVFRKPNLGPVRQLIQNRLGFDALARVDHYGTDVLFATK